MTTAASTASVPPLPFVVASWLGYSLEHIVDGLRRGSIAPPEGAPPGWLPAGADAIAPASDEAMPGDGDAAEGGGAGTSESAAPDDVADPAEPTDLRSTWFDLAQAVDATLDDARFDALWDPSGPDDAARAARVGDLLWRTVAGEVPADDSPDELASAIAERGTRGSLIALADEGSDALARRARTDPSVLRALAALDDFAFAGVENGDAGTFERFDSRTGEANASDAWIEDRAKFLAWRHAVGDDGGAGSHAAANWRFVDRTLGDAATVTVGTGGPAVGEVVFARDGGDTVTGSAVVDRVYGGSGGDLLEGGGGDDRVEGRGGNDRLAGGEGNDRIEGGAGDDALEGGAGDDRLAGGQGDDTYEFSPGDGHDLIVDSDGMGRILVDGAALTGSEAGVSFRTESDGAGATTLVVRTAADGRTPGEIRVRDWHDGALGIHLAGPEGTASPHPAPLSGSEHVARVPGFPEPVPVTKPRVTASQGTMAGIAPAVFEREDGNESGMGMPSDPRLASADPIVAAVGRAEARGRALDAADWALAMRRGPGFASGTDVAAPPAYDAAAITSVDVAGALADAAGDHEDGEVAIDALRLPWWSHGDARSAIAPPDFPPRHGS